jgi:uncharacterized membrane protein
VRKSLTYHGEAVALWLGFFLISTWLAWQGYVAEAVPYGDVSFIYEFWAAQAATGAGTVGIDFPWVYPVVALLPIMFPLIAGTSSYAIGWIILVTALNAGAFAFLLYSAPKTSRNKLQRHAAWWWLLFLVLLGPIAVARLDSIITPLAIVGLLIAGTRPAIAGALLTVATWIKVSPAALLAAVLVSVKKQKSVLVSVLVTSAVIVLTAMILGAGGNILSFLSQQTTRGLQIEAPLATPFLWLAALGQSGYTVYYDTVILTFQVSGEGTTLAADLSSVLLGFGFIALLVWALLLRRNGADLTQLLPAVALALTMVLIVFNKVGSPQYIGWLAAPIIAGLVMRRSRFMAAAVISLVLAAFTQSFYPYLYNGLLSVQPLELSLLTVRNIGEVVLLAVSGWLIYESRQRATVALQSPTGSLDS